MAAESNVGARLFLIGKDAVLAGLSEITAATAKLNEEIASGAASSKVAAAGYTEQEAGLVALTAKMDMYQDALATNVAATDALASVGKKAFLGLTAAAAAWGYESVKWAKSYQTSLLQLQTQAGMTTKAMNEVGAAAMKNASKLGTTPNAYLQAAYHPASTGMGTKETIAITDYAAKEAAISDAPLEDTTNSLTSVMKAYGLGANKAESTIAKLNAIVGAGNMHFSNLNSALSSGIASTAKTFGVSLTSIGGALAYLTDRGTPAAQAGTRLRMAISLLGAPSAEASTLLQDAGMTSTQAADSTNSMAQTLYTAGVQPTELSAALRDNKGKGGIYNALALLKKHLAGAGLSAEMQSAMISRSFGGGRMGTTIEAMYNNIPGLGQKSTQIQKGSTTKKYMQDWEKTTKTLSFQLKSLGGEIETLGIKFGDKLLPPLTKVVSAFDDVLKYMDKNKEVAVALGVAVMAILVPAMGLYLQRALLSSGGAIRTVIRGYGNLISGQSAEKAAAGELATADAGLTGASNTAAGAAATEALADEGLAGAAKTAAGSVAAEDLANEGLTGASNTAAGAVATEALADEGLAGAAKTAAGSVAAEDLANDASLATNDAAVSANTADWVANDAARDAGAGGTILGALTKLLGGTAGTVVGVAATAYGMEKLGAHGQSVLNNQKVPKLNSNVNSNSKQAVKTISDLEVKIATLKQEMSADSGRGVDHAIEAVQSWGVFGDVSKWLTAEHIPVLQNNSAGFEARDKVLLSQYQTQINEMKKIDPDEFMSDKPSSGATTSKSKSAEDSSYLKTLSTLPSSSSKPITINTTNHITVELDGKKVTKSVIKHTKKIAALS